MITIDDVREYIENEYHEVLKGLEMTNLFKTKEDKLGLIDNAMSRCNGVMMFLEMKEQVSFEDCDKLWNQNWWKKFWELKWNV